MTHIKDQKTVARGQGLNDPYGISLRYPFPGLPRYDLMELRSYTLPDRLDGWCTAGKIKMEGGVKILLDIDRVLSAEKDTLEKTV